jgi:simple sugar transport system permease protein
MFAIAALLVSGATVTQATVGQALLGTVLFHTLFVVSPLAGKALAGDAQIGEYFRVFVAYAVITVALVLHAWQTTRAARSASRAAGEVRRSAR